jgi:fermentation-respiration switch protein FrsA (DUF1100 family)
MQNAFYASAVLYMGYSYPKMFLIICGSIVAFTIHLVMNQESVLYIPVIQGIKTVDQNPEGMKSPTQAGMDFEDLMLDVPGDGVTIHAWFIPAKGAKGPGMSVGTKETAPTVLFCHENAGNIGLRMQEFTEIHNRLGVNIMAFDYRGYGASTGTPSEEGLVKDAETALAWLHQQADEGNIDKKRIFLTGRSLGGAVVVQVAAKLGKDAAVAGVVVENSFTSISKMVDKMFPFLALGDLKKKFLRLSWDSITKIRDISQPMLFIGGKQDEIVPAEHMLELYDAAIGASSKKFHQVEDGTHNDTWLRGGEPYWDVKRQFLQSNTAS